MKTSLKKKLKKNKGFTLVELIVIIVIILILSAVLVPSVLKYVDNAHKANVKQDAATHLTQTQAEWAAAQASSITGADSWDDNFGVMQISGVSVMKSEDAVTQDSAQSGTAVFSVSDVDGYDEVTSFVYQDADGYYAYWDNDLGWEVDKLE